MRESSRRAGRERASPAAVGARRGSASSPAGPPAWSAGASRPDDWRPSRVARTAASGTLSPSACRRTSSLRASGPVPSRVNRIVHSGKERPASSSSRSSRARVAFSAWPMSRPVRAGVLVMARLLSGGPRPARGPGAAGSAGWRRAPGRPGRGAAGAGAAGAGPEPRRSAPPSPSPRGARWSPAREHDLAGGLPGAQRVQGLDRSGPVADDADLRVQPSVGDHPGERGEVLPEGLLAGGVDAEALEPRAGLRVVEVEEGDLAALTAGQAVGGGQAALREPVDRVDQHGPADPVDDEVERPAVLADLGDHGVGAERAHLLDPRGPADVGGDDRSGGAGQLHSEAPDATAGAGDQHAPAEQRTAGAQRPERR